MLGVGGERAKSRGEGRLKHSRLLALKDERKRLRSFRRAVTRSGRASDRSELRVFLRLQHALQYPTVWGSQAGRP